MTSTAFQNWKQIQTDATTHTKETVVLCISDVLHMIVYVVYLLKLISYQFSLFLFLLFFVALHDKRSDVVTSLLVMSVVGAITVRKLQEKQRSDKSKQVSQISVYTWNSLFNLVLHCTRILSIQISHTIINQHIIIIKGSFYPLTKSYQVKLQQRRKKKKIVSMNFLLSLTSSIGSRRPFHP